MYFHILIEIWHINFLCVPVSVSQLSVCLMRLASMRIDCVATVFDELVRANILMNLLQRLSVVGVNLWAKYGIYISMYILI